MNLLEQVLFEALTPELKKALNDAGHPVHISKGSDEAASIAMVHDNPRINAGTKTIKDVKTGEVMYGGAREGPYRVSFLDKPVQGFSDSGDAIYGDQHEPSAHLAFDKPEDAVRHFTAAKHLHSIGIPNDLIKGVLGAGSYYGQQYTGSEPIARRDAFNMLRMHTTHPKADEVLGHVEKLLPMAKHSMSAEMEDLISYLGKGSQEESTYVDIVNNVASVLTEDVQVSPIFHIERKQPDQVRQSGYKMSYRKLAQIATAMGAAGAAYTPD
jgi:hypothetical protein